MSIATIKYNRKINKVFYKINIINSKRRCICCIATREGDLRNTDGIKKLEIFYCGIETVSAYKL